jgi:hypothetical protein
MNRPVTAIHMEMSIIRTMGMHTVACADAQAVEHMHHAREHMQPRPRRPHLEHAKRPSCAPTEPNCMLHTSPHCSHPCCADTADRAYCCGPVLQPNCIASGPPAFTTAGSMLAGCHTSTPQAQLCVQSRSHARLACKTHLIINR